ncbi:MAG: glutamate-5-semialdehyde dehydrogenase [Candidatus Paceibacterota bacterium]|jgi:glutamate-5-semialdehyde dehydrogenase
MKTVLEQAKKAKEASILLRKATSKQKNDFLLILSKLLIQNSDKILKENAKDLTLNKNITSAMKKRLEISKAGLENISKAVFGLSKFPDPVGKVVSVHKRKDGLIINRVRTPIGVIACIFESRPNVIIDVASLCIKSGNAVIVRGGKEALNSNTILLNLIQKALAKSNLPKDSVQKLEDRKYEAINELISLEKYIDLVIPRGREELINSVVKNSRIPVIKHVRGLCHCYIDKDADLKKAVNIILNAKTSNPATCNSIETILIHKMVVKKILPKLLEKLFEKKVEVRGDETVVKFSNKCKKATEQDWGEEYLALTVSIKVVNSYDEAIKHISKYSSSLTDSIITENKNTAEKFKQDVDSAVVLINASNRLSDGGEFGLGGEIGISTARIHMRGPMGLEDLTVTKYIVVGNGHIRK